MLTVVMATHNGAGTLPATMASFLECEPPNHGWKFVVVDNASSDNSRDILDSYSDRLPLEVRSEPIPGKNRALNLAIEHVEGDLVLFTDDDVCVDAGWMRAYERAAADHPDYDLFGGAIQPRWPGKPPQWILDAIPLGPVFTITPESLEEGPVLPGVIWGPSMAVRRGLFAAGHRFDPSVGPAPGSYVMGSETEFNKRMGRAGHRAWFCPSARVEHIIRESQLDPRWILGRARRFGRASFWDQASWDADMADGFSSMKMVFGIPRWAIRAAGEQWLLSLWYRLVRDRERSLRTRWEVGKHIGYMMEARRAIPDPPGESRDTLP